MGEREIVDIKKNKKKIPSMVRIKMKKVGPWVLGHSSKSPAMSGFIIP